MESVNSIGDLVNLVDSLYTEKDPAKIGSLQTYLQQVQKSSDGIPFADLLLSTPGYSLNCKFFGALTYTVNLSQQPNNLDIDSILLKLLQHLTSAIHDYRVNKIPNLFIIKKLYNNLSKILSSYTVSHKQWTDPLNPIVQILLSDQVPDLTQVVDYQQLLPTLISDQTTLSLLLTYATIIIEDLAKLIGDNVEVHQVVRSNVYSVIKIIFITIFQSPNDTLKLLCLPHLNSWITYISFVEVTTTVRYRDLNEILQYLLEFFKSQNEDLYQASVETLTQIFETNPHLLNLELRTKFNSLLLDPLIQLKISEFFKTEDLTSLENFVVLMISSLDVDIVHVATVLFLNESSQKDLLPLLISLTSIPLLPILEENISSKLIDFWTQLSELFVDEFDTIQARLKQDESLIEETKTNSKNTFLQVALAYFNKIQLQVTSNPSFKQDENEYFSYRQDVADLFESLYSNLGISFYQGLIQNVITSSDLNVVEASLFLLKMLTPNLSNDDEVLAMIDSLFDSDFLTRYDSLCSQLDNKISPYYLKSSIGFLGSINFFYKRKGEHHLNSVIGYLFNALKNYSSLQSIISRTIVEICDECRLQLYNSLSNFEPILVEMINNPSIDSYIREKIIHSIGCIIQSVPDPGIQATQVLNIVKLIEQASTPLLLKIDYLNNVEFDYLTSLYACLDEIVESLGMPEENEENLPEIFESHKAFYTNYDEIKNFTLQLINVFSNHISFIGKTVEIFKTGLLENFGPFSFNSDSVIQFAVSKLSSNSPILSHLLELLTTVLNIGLRRSTPTHQKVNNELVILIINKFIIEQIEFIDKDPDLLQLSVNLFTTIIINNPSVLLQYGDTFKFIINKTLDLLRTSEERFVKKSLLKFWTNLIAVRKVTAQEAEDFKVLFEQEIGSILTYSVFNGLISTVRSDVDSYSNIIVVLLSKYQLHFKNWLKVSLDKIDEERISRNQTPLPEKEFFMKQLLLTRGSTRKCNTLIKEYWAKANGLMSYQKMYNKE